MLNVAIIAFFGSTWFTSCICEILNFDPLQTSSREYFRSENLVLWPNATVPFYINKDHFDVMQQNIILAALFNFQMKTCIKFLPVPTLPMSKAVLLFENPNGINRFIIPTWGHSVDEPHRVVVGYKGLMSPYLEMLIMKALGFPFEHNRLDRHTYINVNFNNIETSYLQHFARDNFFHYERFFKYDGQSVMHFKMYQFSKNGQKSFTYKPENKENDTMLSLTQLDLHKIHLVYGPECIKRDRQEKKDTCQTMNIDKRVKRSIYSFPRKSLRVNPDITPPPMQDLAELDHLKLTDVVKEITEHVQVVSNLIVKTARAKLCNVSINEPYDYNNNEKIKEAISKIERYAQLVIEQAQSSSKDFCDVKPTFKACEIGHSGKHEQCTPTKSKITKHSTQHKAIPETTNFNLIKDNLTIANNITTVTKRDGGIRVKREADNELGMPEEPSRRLVKKFRKKSTPPPPPPTTPWTSMEITAHTTEAPVTTIKINTQKTIIEAMKPKAEDDDYEEVEEIVEDDSLTTMKIRTQTTPQHQKRFKKKYVERPQTDNKEEDMANFNEQTQKPTRSVSKPNPASKIKQPLFQQPKNRKPTTLPKKLQNQKFESTEAENEASGVKNVKVIMEYNMPGKSHSSAKNPQYQQEITGRQEEEEKSSEANEGVEDEEVETQEAEDEEESDQPPVVIPEQQPDTPSPEIYVNQFQPDPDLSQKKRLKHKPTDTDEEDRPMTTRKSQKYKKFKNVKPLKTYKPIKPQKTRIIGPGAPSINYQSPTIPKTIKLNKKNLEFYNERKWNEPVIPYVITEYKQYNTDDLRRRLKEVIRVLKKRTCVRLQEVSLKDAEESYEDFLIIDTSPDYVTGRVGGKQHFGSVELFEGGQHRQHAAMMIMAMLGFYFEVARHDRDHYVRVHLRHVRADKLHHFEKIRDDATFPLPYDYKSATHPAWQFWRKLGKKGISTVATYKETDPSGTLMKTLGQNPNLLSEYDIIKINTIYGVDCFKKSGLIVRSD